MYEARVESTEAIGRILADCPSPQRRASGGEGLPWAAYCELMPLTQIDADGIGVDLDMPTELGLRSQPPSDTCRLHLWSIRRKMITLLHEQRENMISTCRSGEPSMNATDLAHWHTLLHTFGHWWDANGDVGLDDAETSSR